jgi:hypothetical protein
MKLADADDRNGENERAGKQPDLPLPEADSPSKAVSGRAIEARLPALYKIIGAREAAAIRHRILKDRRANKLVAPRVNVFSGQSASIVDAIQRAFVVGFQEGGEPQIRWVTEGTTLRVRPSLFDEDRIGLAYDLKLNRVTDVSTTTFRIEGRNEPVTVQVPEVETTSVECSLTFASGKTLLIGGLKTKDEKGEMQAVLVMLKATRQPAVSQTGQPMLGSGVNSKVGAAGQIVLEESSFEMNPQRSVEQRLSQRINAPFTNLPLHEALAVISRQIDLPIEIDLEDVAAEGVTPKRPVSLSIGETSADNALRLLFETHHLRYSLEDNTVVVRGKSSAPMIAAVYNIADLLEHDLDWLIQPEVAALLQAIDQAAEDADCKNVALPKITLFNGQSAQLSAQENGLFKLALEYQAVSCFDHRSIFLKVATDAKLSLDEQLLGEMLAPGSSLLVRVDDSPAGAWKSEATQDSPTPTEHVHLLLVTPTVIVLGQ